MKISRNWLQEYFEQALPSVEELAEALTFHSFEIEEVVSSDVFDVKVLPDRAADCLSHRGVAREIGAVLNQLVLSDSLRHPVEPFPESGSLKVSIDNQEKYLRYMAAYVRGVKVGSSPAWLKEALESVGQRSINNVVDATNFVMLNIGQPLHAFDAARLQEVNGKFSILVRESAPEEKIVTLTGEEYALPEGTLLITDANTNAPIGIAGVKGGKAAEISNDTIDIIIESANFDGVSVRKTSQALKLWTDASQRYQNKISPELASYGMRDVLELIQQVAGGELEGVIDVYPPEVAHAAKPEPLEITVEKINAVLGTSYTAGDVKHVFDRLDFRFQFIPFMDPEHGPSEEKGTYIVMPPFERRDLTIPETLIEEVGRILGYEQVKPEQMPELPVGRSADQARYRGIERVKDFLTERGFTEISTQTFAAEEKEGGKSADEKIMLANPLDQTRPALRSSLAENMEDALMRATNVAPRVLGPAAEVKLFEIGTIFKKDSEELSLVLGYKQLTGKQSQTLLSQTLQDLAAELPGAVQTLEMQDGSFGPGVGECILSIDGLIALGKAYEPRKVLLGPYKQFSQYPFALRDIAVWTPEGTEESEVSSAIVGAFQKHVEDMNDVQLARIDLFDRFSKQIDAEEKVSYAFRLVFESFERTLSDAELNPLMDAITAALNQKWQVR